ncbi:MAG: sulfite exporter TauE/SafE family protein [Parcubacteria group bacterium]|nr:sulfite exporter TauE/SafE family protein [Parcubacteria group bacterium]
MDLYIIIIASIVTFISAWFGSLAGGGGLVVVPVLISLGIPLPIILGCRRMTVLGGNITSFIKFYQWKKIDYKLTIFLSIFGIVGAIIGNLFVTNINENILKKIIGSVIIIFAIFLFFENKAWMKNLKGKLYKYRKIIGPPVAILALFLSVIIGGGAGPVLTYLLIMVYGNKILESAGNRKMPIFFGSLISLIIFMKAGLINYPLAISMFFAHALGGWFGSQFFLKKGEKKIRTFFFIVIIILGINILFF